MADFATGVLQTLGVRLPKDYAGFMERYQKKLSEDPVHTESWLKGLGSPGFVMGTTSAFRSTLPKFGRESVVIGYLGIKTLIVNKTYEEIDEYLTVDCRDGSIHAVDSFGVTKQLAPSFEQWIGPELLRVSLREKYTSNLTVIVFDDELKADEARLKLLKLQREGLVELEDAVVVIKGADGRVNIQQLHKLAKKGGAAGSITGLIVGSILFSPLLGVVFGAVSGAVSASLTDVGVDDRFMKDLAAKFNPGSSALFTLIRRADPERVAKEFFGMGGRVLVNSVSREREAAIQALLDGATEAAE